MPSPLDAALADAAPVLSRWQMHQIDEMRTASNGGDALVDYANDRLAVRFTQDRRQVFCDVRAAAHSEWYSVDLLWAVIRGEQPDSALWSDAFRDFLTACQDEIADLFAPDRVEATVHLLDEARSRRAAIMWP